MIRATEPAVIDTFEGDIRNLHGLTLGHRLTGHAFSLLDRIASQGPGDVLRIAQRRARAEFFGRFVVVEDLPRLRSRQLIGVSKDRGEDGIEIESRTHRAADLAEGFELVDRAAELRSACLELLEQPRVLDCDHRLVGEGLQHGDLSFGEHRGLGTGDGDCTNRAAVAEHRARQARCVSRPPQPGSAGDIPGPRERPVRRLRLWVEMARAVTLSRLGASGRLAGLPRCLGLMPCAATTWISSPSNV